MEVNLLDDFICEINCEEYTDWTNDVDWNENDLDEFQEAA